MTNVIRVLLLSTVFPLIMASQADACWLCWKSHHTSHYATTSGGGGSGGGGAASGGGLAVNTEDAVRPEAGLAPTRVSAAPGAVSPAPNADPTVTNTQPVPSEISSKLDNMSAQLDRIEKSLTAPAPPVPAIQPDVDSSDIDAAVKKALLTLLSDPDVKAALKEAVK